ncbi:MAG TPA: hypothetical protein DCR43_06665 [Bacteroidales bacterium]|nr:hypothetical protein [Bacteroidales bacterium]HBZ66819.1 hypothetical protein [Bacteroidales bacterium]
MKKSFQIIMFFTVLLLFHSGSVEAQRICRCSGSGQLTFFCEWYEAGFPNPGVNHGFIHTDDYGETISFYDTTFKYFSNLTGDRSLGLIYGVNSNIQRSYDNGANWDTTLYNHNISYTLFFEGNQAGELFLFNDYDHNLYQSIDSGASFQLISSLVPHCNGRLVAGSQPGVLLGIDTSRRFFRSYDNGQTFEYIQFPDEIQNLVENTNSNYTFTITAGAVAEEVYVGVTKSNGEVNVYQSLNHGSTFSYKSTFPYYNYDQLKYIAGRESNEFYAIRFESVYFTYDPSIITYDLQISYSSDGGATFNTYSHLLYNELIAGEMPLPSVPSISLSPNPATDAVWLRDIPTGEVVTAIEISNLSGQSVFNYNCKSAVLHGQSLQVNLPPTLAAGCYVVKVMGGNRVVGREKFMIVK